MTSLYIFKTKAKKKRKPAAKYLFPQKQNKQHPNNTYNICMAGSFHIENIRNDGVLLLEVIAQATYKIIVY